jgi:predicted  nucleic acid-binding Zn-ribbon protein
MIILPVVLLAYPVVSRITPYYPDYPHPLSLTIPAITPLCMGTPLKIEELVKELSELGKMKPLSGEKLTKAKKLMRQLRGAGFRNEQVTQLTNQIWSKDTIKRYTRGTEVNDPAPKKRAMELLGELMARGMALEEVERALLVRKGLEASGVSVDDVSSFLDDIKKSKIDMKDMLRVYSETKNSGLTLQQLTALRDYRSQLEAAGIKADSLKTIYETSNSYGGYDKVMEALKTYGDLPSLRQEANDLENRKVQLQKSVEELSADVTRLEEGKQQIQDALSTYEKLKKQGFDENSLASLKASSEKYGGARGVLDAVKAYGTLTALQETIVETQRNLTNLESEVKNAKAEHSHLMTVIGMSEDLLYKHNFSVSAIVDIYNLAKKYGKPPEVLGAVTEYGEMKAIETENKRLSATRDELEKRNAEIQREIQNQHAVIESVRELSEKYGIGADEIVKIRSLAQKHGPPGSILQALDTYVSLKQIEEQKAELEASIQELIQSEASLRGRIKALEDRLTALPVKADESVQGVKLSLEKFSNQVQGLGDTIGNASTSVDSLMAAALAAGRDIAAMESQVAVYKHVSMLIDFLREGKGEEDEVVPVAVATLGRLSKWVEDQPKYSKIRPQVESLKDTIGKQRING